MYSEPLWIPPKDRIESTKLYSFMRKAETYSGRDFPDYASLWQWSIDQPAQFWSLLWDFAGVTGHKGERALTQEPRMQANQWFPDASLNFAENLLAGDENREALVFWGEDKVQRRMTLGELRREVSRCAQALTSAGVETGDRVAGFLPNMPETLVAMLATASLGAVWCSASPDFGPDGVLDRFSQIEPKVLFCVDGYYYNGKSINCLAKNEEVVSRLPSLTQAVTIRYLGIDLGNEDSALQSWQNFLSPHAPSKLSFKRLPFNHPLFILFSSGTTGAPKCIVHSAGGTLLQHIKEHQLHADIKPGDRVFYFTTCGWMMWNWLISALASEATLLLYDGNPFAGHQQIIFNYADQENMTHLGTSAKFIEAAQKFELEPYKTHHLGSLRVILSTGSPLSPEGFEYVYESIKADLLLASIAGGTDIISCFALGCPILPVWPGELQCRGLGMAVDVFDDQGNSIVQEKGELVCTAPFPSMPIGFWNDPQGEAYQRAYFDNFDNVWCHGDYVELTAHQGLIIYGRSDAVLNPGGVRIGTAEIYRQVEAVPEVMESIVVGQPWDNDVRVVLFVKLRDNLSLDGELIKKIKTQIRDKTTPRHVPAKVIQVADIPRTKSGKIVELAVRDLLLGREIKNREALANPEALNYFKDHPELQT